MRFCKISPQPQGLLLAMVRSGKFTSPVCYEFEICIRQSIQIIFSDGLKTEAKQQLMET